MPINLYLFFLPSHLSARDIRSAAGERGGRRRNRKEADRFFATDRRRPFSAEELEAELLAAEKKWGIIPFRPFLQGK